MSLPYVQRAHEAAEQAEQRASSVRGRGGDSQDAAALEAAALRLRELAVAHERTLATAASLQRQLNEDQAASNPRLRPGWRRFARPGGHT